MTPAATLLGGRYQLDELIGAGGYCEVWRAADTVLNRPVAVKLLHPGYAHQAEALARFQAEARHAGSFSHPNIARVYDYGEPVGHQPPFLVMELVEGPSLAVVLGRGPLDAARAMDVVAQSATGLQAAHAAGLIHRDIKPANILFAPGGLVKITDFGVAHAMGAAPLTATGMVMGTPGYIAPERVNGAQAQPPSDLYALGIVAYECLTGAQPFTGTALEVALAHRDRPLPPLPPWVPAEVVELVMSLTAKDPQWRPVGAAEVATWAARLRDDLRGGPHDGPGAAPDAAWFVPVAVPDVPAAAPPQPQGGLPPEPPRGTRQDPQDSTAVEAWGPVPGARRRSRGRPGKFGRGPVPVLAAIVLVALVGLGLASMAGFGPVAHRSGGTTSTPPGQASAGPASPAASPSSPRTSASAAGGTSATPAATVSSGPVPPAGPAHTPPPGPGHTPPPGPGHTPPSGPGHTPPGHKKGKGD